MPTFLRSTRFLLPRRWPRLLASLLVGFAAAAGAVGAAHAADVQYPFADRLGLVPPPGLRLIGKTPGFQDPDHNVSMLLLELPLGVFAELRPTMDTALARQHGIIIDRRETLFTDAGVMLLSAGEDTAHKARKWMLLGITHGFTALVSMTIPDAARKLYPDAAVRASLQTLTLRDPPLNEEIDSLPFAFGDLAGFHVTAVMSRSIALLTRNGDKAPNVGEKSKGDNAHLEPSRLVVGVHPTGPLKPDDRPRLAAIAFNALPGFVDRHITNAEPIRINGQPAYEIRADAKDAATGAAVVLVQWLRFGGGAVLQIVGVSSKQNWSRDFPQFRAVRDGIMPKS